MQLADIAETFDKPLDYIKSVMSDLRDTFEEVFPVMEKRGLKGVLFVPTGLFTGDCPVFRQDNSKFMVLWMIKEMRKSGWEIGSHSMSHPRMGDISGTSTAKEISGSWDFFHEHGFRVTSFSIPYGNSSPEAIEAAHAYYSSVRGSEKGLNQMPLNKSGVLRSVSLTSPTAYDEAVYWMNAARKNGGYLILNFHFIRGPDSCPEAWVCRYSTAPETLERILEYANQSGAPVMNVGDVVRMSGN
jgi:peptidoglycan/xylan/chitin deacetylase (PgdA/CDA1 family)